MVCSSMSWPNMFDVARNKVNLYNDAKSITNRIKLLLLTEPTELYMNPNFGVGLKKYVFKYNNDNAIAQLRDELIAQLRLWEPAVIPEQTTISRVEHTDPMEPELVVERLNTLHLTVTVTTAYMEEISFSVTESDIPGII